MKLRAPLFFAVVFGFAASASAADSGAEDAHVGSTSDATVPIVDARAADARGPAVADASPPGIDGARDDGAAPGRDASVGSTGGAPVIFGSGGSAGQIDLDAADSHDGQLRQYFVPNGDARHASDCSCTLATRESFGSPFVLVLGALSWLGLRRRR